MNKRLPYFFRDRSTEYFGLIHAALFGSETVEVEEAEKLLGISKETVAQLKQYEEEREDMEASHLRASTIEFDMSTYLLATKERLRLCHEFWIH